MRTRSIRNLRAVLIGLIPLVVLAAPAAARAQDDNDPNLRQNLPELAIAHGRRVLDAGHVDVGPKFDNGTWRFLIHDDMKKADANATSVWRYPAETVLRVLDQARATVPDDSAYAFVGAKPGAPVWVIPQTQDPQVVWLGWNTQDPQVMRTIDRGITLSLTGVRGPGVVTVYLHSGSFGEPQVLWDSRKTAAQPVWVDVNTHTHANWVFSQPGVYLLQMQAQADLVDGRQVSDTQLIRVAVGTATTPDQALAATWNGASASAAATSGAVADDRSAAETGRSSTGPLLIAAIALAVGLIAVFAVVAVRGSRAKRRILTARGIPEASIEDGDPTP
jgi:putative ABC transporter-associated repeat protein